jgi:predicted NUDIX family NTP pyrophosphohydrolase
MRTKTSAGLLMFRKVEGRLEVLLAHPGGPFFENKDAGAWSIPKGEATGEEDLLARAQIEFEEELGITSKGPFIELGHVKQKGGKTVHAWAFEGNLSESFVPASNTFKLEWPRSPGRIEQFPEIDRAQFFALEEAKRKINPAQTLLLDRLLETAKPLH